MPPTHWNLHRHKPGTPFTPQSPSPHSPQTRFPSIVPPLDAQLPFSLPSSHCLHTCGTSWSSRAAGHVSSPRPIASPARRSSCCRERPPHVTHPQFSRLFLRKSGCTQEAEGKELIEQLQSLFLASCLLPDLWHRSQEQPPPPAPGTFRQVAFNR